MKPAPLGPHSPCAWFRFLPVKGGTVQSATETEMKLCFSVKKVPAAFVTVSLTS